MKQTTNILLVSLLSLSFSSVFSAGTNSLFTLYCQSDYSTKVKKSPQSDACLNDSSGSLALLCTAEEPSVKNTAGFGAFCQVTWYSKCQFAGECYWPVGVPDKIICTGH